MARRVQAENLRFAFHNHDWELQPLPDGSMPLDHLLDAVPPRGSAGRPTSPGWSAAATTRWPGSSATPTGSTSVHVKDIAPAGQNEDEDGWADVGHGTLDWAKLWQRSAAAGCTLLIAEHDKPSDAARFAAAASLPAAACRSRLMSDTLRLGILGCGMISDTYLTRAGEFEGLEVVACADIDQKRAQAQASRYGVEALDPEALIASPDIDIVINLTLPTAHAAIGQAVLAAGKHLYAEKPLGRDAARKAASWWRPLPRRPAHRLRPRHLPGRRPSERPPPGRRGRDRPARRRHHRLHEPRHGGLAPQPRPSSSSAAAARSSTSAPTTSPRWSTCSARSAASARSQPVPSRSASSPPSRATASAFRSRCRPTSTVRWSSPAAPSSPSPSPGTSGPSAPTARALRHRGQPAPPRPELLRRCHRHLPQGLAVRARRAAGPGLRQPNRPTRRGTEVADYRIIGVVDMARAIQRGPSAPLLRRAGAARAGGADGARALGRGRGGGPDRDTVLAARSADGSVLTRFDPARWSRGRHYARSTGACPLLRCVYSPASVAAPWARPFAPLRLKS